MGENNQAVILAIEDEPEIRRFLRMSLTAHGYKFLEAANGKEAKALAASDKPDLMIMDLMLPDIDGVQLIRQLREWYAKQIIVLSARDQEADKVEALDAGADDYLTKPFGMQELLARIRVALRHARPSNDSSNSSFSFGKVHVDLANRVITVDGAEVHLTPTEYKLLLVLIQNAGKVVLQQQLLREVWGPGYAKEGHYLRIYMAQLRQKLEEDPSRPQYLITEPGIGCRLRIT